MREICHYCSREVFVTGSIGATEFPRQVRTRDHINSSSSGMRIDHKSNYVVACAECNETKADTPYEIFTYWLRQQGIKHGLSNRKAYRRFCYDLMRAGFVAAIALINYREKARETGGGSQMSRRLTAKYDRMLLAATDAAHQPVGQSQ